VGEFIFRNGGTYHFGNATCRKKWDEVQRNMG
jgi:YHS domain-containing protein